MKKIFIVGSPNVGKSVLFNNLTGTYAVVSNYPGTTVEVTRGTLKLDKQNYEVVDTPGIYSLIPITEEERVTREILLREKADLVLHIIDAKNIVRMLPLTIQIIETGLPVLLVLNIMDEAERMGIQFNFKELETTLGIPVVPTVSTLGQGMDTLKKLIQTYQYHPPGLAFKYSPEIESFLSKFNKLPFKTNLSFSTRSLNLFYLQGEKDTIQIIRNELPDKFDSLDQEKSQIAKKYAHPLGYIIGLQRQEQVDGIVSQTVKSPYRFGQNFAAKLSQLMMNPWTGFPILVLVLYWGLYKFVGEFGAGTVVDFIEETLFGKYLLPPMVNFIHRLIPWEVLASLFIGEYGILTLGVRYAFALILPIVTFFFLVFAIIEDSGYLPRLAMLVDRMFKQIGLSGRAVIPMVLGLGCDTMATMVTRTLPTKRERVIATLLLALAVPCSAQLGVILALLSNHPRGLAIWLLTLLIIFAVVGFITGKILPGEKPVFFMEIPPLRVPKITNVLVKTYSRLDWYFREIFPLFILASLLIWLGQLIGLFDGLVYALSFPVRWLGLPDKTAVSFLFGFFRRDYGAAGLYDMDKSGMFTEKQLIVAVVTMTLFLPCIAQFLMNVKERGWKTGLGISVFVLFFAFAVGWFLHVIL